MSPKPATLLALQKTGYAQFIGWRKEVYHYDEEVKAHSQDLPVKDMYWCSKETPTKDSLLECLNQHSPDAILMVDTAYYEDYNQSLSDAVKESGLNPKIVSVHNYYDTEYRKTYHDVISNKPAVSWEQTKDGLWEFNPADNATTYTHKMVPGCHKCKCEVVYGGLRFVSKCHTNCIPNMATHFTEVNITDEKPRTTCSCRKGDPTLG